MKKLRVGLVGFGFIGPHHLDAIRRTGLGEVTAIATSNPSSARAKAEQFGVAKSTSDWRVLVADPEIDVIDIATPTNLHALVALAALAAGKHVIVDKPLSLTSTEAASMLAAAQRAGVVHAVTFNIRYNVMLQHARALVTRGEIGDVRFVRGHYLQEWLLKDTDFNWRLQPNQAGALAMVADCGAHWYDIAQHITGQRITRVLADLSSFIPIRRRPAGGSRAAHAAGNKSRTTAYRVQVPDLGLILCEFENGARGQFATSALCSGHKNDLTIEVAGARASVRWEQERPDELWLGHRDQPNQLLRKDPPLLDPTVRHYAALPGGHAEAWPDAFRNLMRNILGFIAAGRDPREADEIAFPTFATGLSIARIVDAIAASAKAGGRWKSVTT
ncbi:MAG: Gfo/Idh/MocA family oxidoreductase [Lacunisphaera sp.]|jgi:predicted dehydrogenase|nr:Gfo/Idh/MocA family oxidoreductase [Lacunisphaera sp.]